MCGGLAHTSGIAPWLCRLAFALLTFCSGAGLLVYLMLWIFVPQQISHRPRQIGT
jgi:phage shock protein PspC (stress-responsive transcriptional regulator)